MLKGTLALVSAAIAAFELLGFFFLTSYLNVLGITAHFGGIPIFELPRWGFYAFTKELPVWVVYTLGILAAFSIVAFLIDRVPGPIRVFLPSTDTPTLSEMWWLWVARLQLVFRPVTIPTIQAFCLLILFIWGISSFGNAGEKFADSIISGTPPLARTDLHVGSSIHLDSVPGKRLPSGIAGENARGSLVFLWQDDKNIYVAPRHRSPHKFGQRAVFDWFAISRDQLADIKYDVVWDSTQRPTSTSGSSSFMAEVSFWGLIAVVVSSPLILAISIVREARRNRVRPSTLSITTVTTSLPAILDGSASVLRTIYKILVQGRDVEIVRAQRGYLIESEFLRHDALPDDTRLTLNTPLPKVP
jgi:hypothetical protein